MFVIVMLSLLTIIGTMPLPIYVVYLSVWPDPSSSLTCLLSINFDIVIIINNFFTKL